MATAQKWLPLDASSDVNFDAVGAGLYDAIVNTFGWVEKTDTGRTNWASNPARPGASTYLWNIFGPNDSLQTGGTVYYLRLEVGQNASSQLSIRVSIGTGTDGSGVLTGYVLGPIALNGYTHPGNLGNNGWECSFSGDAGRFGILLWRNTVSANASSAIFIERTLASDGTPNSTGVTLVISSLFATGNNDAYQQSIVFGKGTTTQRGIGATLAAIRTVASDEFNNLNPVSPIFPAIGKFSNPMTVCASVCNDRVGEGSICKGILYGIERTFMSSQRTAFLWFGGNATSNQALLMRYD